MNLWPGAEYHASEDADKRTLTTVTLRGGASTVFDIANGLNNQAVTNAIGVKGNPTILCDDLRSLTFAAIP